MYANLTAIKLLMFFLACECLDRHVSGCLVCARSIEFLGQLNCTIPCGILLYFYIFITGVLYNLTVLGDN